MESNHIQSMHQATQEMSRDHGRKSKRRHQNKTHTISSPHTWNPKHSNKKYSIAELDALVEAEIIREHEAEAMMDIDEYHSHEINNIKTIPDKRVDIPGEETFAKVIQPQVEVRQDLHNIALVVDTNYVLSHLDILEELRVLAPKYSYRIVVPKTVLQELDGLKNSNKVDGDYSSCQRKEPVSVLARRANNWLYSNLANLDSYLIVQKMREKLDLNSAKDDAILDCCLYYGEVHKYFVVLLSNDKNLCMKALAEEVPTVSYRDRMTAQLIASRIKEEYQHRESMVGSPEKTKMEEDVSMDDLIVQDKNKGIDIYEVVSHVQDLVLAAIDDVMHEEYGSELEFISYDKSSMGTLADAVPCFQAFWIAVFSEYFKGSGINKNYWHSLPRALLNPGTDCTLLLEFLSFWASVLDCLYVKKSQQDVDDLHRNLDAIRDMVTKASQH
ncbi:AGR262Wp [Eremothecium gossypii ATCC 10895]|uniref:Transcriptional protein SWT1 n=1 Tax=Eremothecium gossypii (strain ATCC 10895 / CBS 109.51 / FGSC 9923 / NRRL Y-1056) TaxID=284811 RepID=Q74ZD7_EREGS|nr:AGR262Wp [Eremothecium gossypii ATCC 10895]AAS54752.1 AGR262Wp [Eremothecium gossypii ATCC 10895]